MTVQWLRVRFNMAVSYTHNFEFNVNGSFVRGEMTFDSNKKAVLKMNEWSEPFKTEFLARFDELTGLISKIYTEGSTQAKIKNISFKEKV